MSLRSLVGGLCALWVISAAANSPPTKAEPSQSQAASAQQQRASQPVNTPADAITQAASVNQVIAHQPQANVLDQQSRPQQSNDDDDKLHFLGLHIKLDSLVAIFALLVSALAFWTSRSGSREANRIAKEALEFAKATRAKETASQVQFTGINLSHSAIEGGQNNLVAQMQNHGKSPALVKSVAFSAILRTNAAIRCKTMQSTRGTIAPNQTGAVSFEMHLSQDEADSVHDGDQVLHIVADATIEDEVSSYHSRSTFSFDSKVEYAFIMRATGWPSVK